MARLRAALGGVGYALLGLLALAGLALSLAGLLAGFERTRHLVAARLIRFADDALAGSFALEGLRVLPAGGVELRGLRVTDPDGHLVLQVGRARVFAASMAGEPASPVKLIPTHPARRIFPASSSSKGRTAR